MPEPATTFLVATAGITTIATLNNMGGNDIRPITTYQYLEQGGENMDNSLEILNAPELRKDEMWATERSHFLQKHQILQSERNELEDKSDTYIGLVKNWSAARKFYINSSKLYKDTKRASHKNRCRAGIEEAELYAAMKFQTIQLQQAQIHCSDGSNESEQGIPDAAERRMAPPVLNVMPVFSQSSARGAEIVAMLPLSTSKPSSQLQREICQYLGG
ncbi:hypothetical protein BDN70DRAFT_920637 [Pholiota conissans]|uniref:Uncharacterized protein n=1 Tax=Pholiota conissans TaxID=109636 RepID=A0A9P5Z586_9AGAR|nr:hypothetical protein BDN70DRAFT_920637 [Pholiota conissans]